MNTSPPKNASLPHHGYQGCLPTDGSGFPYGGFWERGSCYQSHQPFRIRHSLDEEFDEPVVLTTGTYYLCEEVFERSVSLDSSLDVTTTFVTLRALRPLDGRFIRFNVWPSVTSGFSRVENAMEIIALASIGLAL